MTEHRSSWPERAGVPQWVRRLGWLLLGWAVPLVAGAAVAVAQRLVDEDRLQEAITECVPPFEGKRPSVVCRVGALEARSFGDEQWQRDSASLQVVTLASQVRFEGALYARDARKRAAAGASAELVFYELAQPILTGYWAADPRTRIAYKLDEQLRRAQQKALGTAGSAPP